MKKQSDKMRILMGSLNSDSVNIATPFKPMQKPTIDYSAADINKDGIVDQKDADLIEKTANFIKMAIRSKKS